MIFIKRLFGKKDLLIPYFNFQKVTKDAIGKKILDHIFALRYEVYCLECGFIEPDEVTGGLELDGYDSNSTHFAAYSLTDEIIGTVRLVHADEANRYPFMEHCTVFDNFVFPPSEQCGEISRLVIKNTYRRRRGDTPVGVSRESTGSGGGSIKPAVPGKRVNGSLLLLGLYREMYRHSRETGVRYWFAAMEAPLMKSIGRMGFKFRAIGPVCEYYGPVTVFMADLDELKAKLAIENAFLHAWFHDQKIPPLVLAQTLWDLARSRVLSKTRKRRVVRM